jgi:hypothetical protein
MSETRASAPGLLVAELLLDELVAFDVDMLTAAFTRRGLTAAVRSSHWQRSIDKIMKAVREPSISC